MRAQHPQNQSIKTNLTTATSNPKDKQSILEKGTIIINKKENNNGSSQLEWRQCPHNQHIKREYEGLCERPHSELKPVSFLRSFSLKTLLPFKLLSFAVIFLTKSLFFRS